MTPSVCTALRIEAHIVRAGWPGADIAVVGMRGRHLSQLVPRLQGSPVVLLGFGGGLRPAQQPGDIVVATQVRDPLGAVDLPLASTALAAMSRAGLSSSAGTVWCSDRIVHGAQRARFAADSIVDMESAPVARAVGAHRLVVVRVVVDTPAVGLVRASVTAGRRARRRLREVAAALAHTDFEPDGEHPDIEPITSGTVQGAARAAGTAAAHRTTKEG